MKNRYLKYYNIADIPFSIESFKEIESRSPFSLFETGKCEAKTKYEIYEVPSLRVREDAPLLESSNYRTYKSGNNIERRAGFYRDGKELDPEYAATLFSEKDFSSVKIFIPSERNVPSNESMIFRTLFLEHLLLTNRALILHSSYIITDMGAVLFTAPSGNGKSTQADLWAKHRKTLTINGDCSVIRKTNGVYKAFGIPFSGSSNICKNKSSDIAAIVSLAKAPENRIKRLRGIAAFKAIFEGVKVDIHDTDEILAASAEVSRAAEEIPVFRLECVPDESAVETLEKELRGL